MGARRPSHSDSDLQRTGVTLCIVTLFVHLPHVKCDTWHLYVEQSRERQNKIKQNLGLDF